jgi:hypothetical protein
MRHFATAFSLAAFVGRHDCSPVKCVGLGLSQFGMRALLSGLAAFAMSLIASAPARANAILDPPANVYNGPFPWHHWCQLSLCQPDLTPIILPSPTGRQ